jgi:pilus assembly protein CpaE
MARTSRPMQSIRPLPRISVQAFCETEGIANPIERAAEDRRMAKAHLKVHMGGIQTAVRVLPGSSDAQSHRSGIARRAARTDGRSRQSLRILRSRVQGVVIGHYNDVGFTAT